MKISSLLLTLAVVQAIDWEKHVYDEEEYFKDIPDYVDMAKLRFKFKLTHWFLTGVERALYGDKTLTISSDCFGDQYVVKLNEYLHLFKANPFGDFFENLFPEISLTYQFYYMFTTYCQVDDYIQDYMLFCWYRGCWPDQWLYQIKGKFLYILRAVNDAGIVWYEGVPESEESETDQEQWITLAEQTG